MFATALFRPQHPQGNGQDFLTGSGRNNMQTADPRTTLSTRLGRGSMLLHILTAPHGPAVGALVTSDTIADTPGRSTEIVAARAEARASVAPLRTVGPLVLGGAAREI